MGKAMTKSQTIRYLSDKVDVPRKTAAAFLEELAATAIRETRNNGQFVIPGIGKLVKAHRKARIGRNPQTGEPIKIPAKTVARFRVAKACKQAIVPKR
ncbi:MAG: HU family DNA-binding protein [Terriglobia bacterium]